MTAGWISLSATRSSPDLTDPHPAELYINNHDGTFTNVAEEAGCNKVGFIKGVVAADYDNDGWPDIFMSSLDGHKVLLHNKGVKGRIPQFEDATARAGLSNDKIETFPTWFFDYDNDGWPDLFVCGYSFKGTSGRYRCFGKRLTCPMITARRYAPLSQQPRRHLYRRIGGRRP